jgi:hypothetical protein
MRRHLWFVVLLIAIAAARFTILFLSQTHLTSDEAILGLMAKHIIEGRYLPFYPYGVPYNGSEAWEAYVAVVPYAIFGIGVLALKSSTVVLSLACLALFYVMAGRLHGYRMATLASAILALSPSLLKWHFQPRGYAFYFLDIPLLVLLFLILESRKTLPTKGAFLFGLVSGISVWCLELILPLLATLWALLVLRRKFSIKTFTMAVVGFVGGYGPVIWWNFSHSFANWHFLFLEKPESEGLAARFGLTAWRDIFLYEMPKFFGADTVLWYYPETSWIGYVMYGVSIVAIVMAAVSALRWKQIRNALNSGFTASEANKDLLMLILIGVSFVPYVIAPLRVPGYFLAGWFFLAVLIARLIQRSFACPNRFARFAGAVILLAIITCGFDAMFQTATVNQIETLTLCHGRQDHCMTRIPGADIDAVKEDLRRNHIGAIWTSISFVYPLIFESGETLVASESIFGVDRPVYPPEIPKLEPNSQGHFVFVIETDSPYRAEIESLCERKSGSAPRVTEHGKLTVIEQRLASQGF